MADDPIELTSADKRAIRLKKRFQQHIKEWWKEYDERYPDKDFTFIVGDSPHEIWCCDFAKPQTEPVPQSESDKRANEEETPKIWLLWNAEEITSNDSLQDIFIDFINDKKARRLDSKLKYYTSPLTISAVLAVLMLFLIATLQFLQKNVPQELWTVFTAVVAFYFGKEGSGRPATEPEQR